MRSLVYAIILLSLPFVAAADANHVILPAGRNAESFALDIARQPEGLRLHLPAIAPEDPAPRLGLFIGIDRYPLMPGQDLEGCVRDAWHLHQLMTQRFGVRYAAVLTNAQATRAAIADALASLMQAVEALRQRGDTRTIPIVITFSGHGRQVIDPTGREADGLDETWIAADSGSDAANDIRDVEINLVVRRLIDLGAKVLLISDSCHSGSVHRSAARLRSIHANETPAGPNDDLFSQRFGSATQLRGATEEAMPGLIFFAACHEARQALEHEEAPDIHSGRFTYALRRALARSLPETTYRQLFAEVLLEFERVWPGDRMQRPYFFADPITAGERFMEGGRPHPHAVIIPPPRGAETDGDLTLRLSMGTIDGVALGANFSFYANLEDLTNGRDLIAQGEVIDVSATSSIVRLREDDHVLPTAVASLDLVRLRDVRVALHDRGCPTVPGVLRALDERGQLTLVDAETRADFIVIADHLRTLIHRASTFIASQAAEPIAVIDKPTTNGTPPR